MWSTQVWISSSPEEFSQLLFHISLHNVELQESPQSSWRGGRYDWQYTSCLKEISCTLLVLLVPVPTTTKAKRDVLQCRAQSESCRNILPVKLMSMFNSWYMNSWTEGSAAPMLCVHPCVCLWLYRALGVGLIKSTRRTLPVSRKHQAASHTLHNVFRLPFEYLNKFSNFSVTVSMFCMLVLLIPLTC